MELYHGSGETVEFPEKNTLYKGFFMGILLYE